MTPGKLARLMLGPSLFSTAGSLYRSIFVDLRKMVGSVVSVFPEGAHVLDIGGGDGEVLNHLLRLRPDVTVTMIDPAGSIGAAILPSFRPRVAILPLTDMKKYILTDHPPIDGVMINDVVHHIPVETRAEFFRELKSVLTQCRSVPIVIKDVAPGGFRSWLSVMADRHITGDKSVSLISCAELKALICVSFPGAVITDTELLNIDGPNYSIVVRTRPRRV